jgi:hypothetical protein
MTSSEKEPATFRLIVYTERHNVVIKVTEQQCVYNAIYYTAILGVQCNKLTTFRLMIRLLWDLSEFDFHCLIYVAYGMSSPEYLVFSLYLKVLILSYNIYLLKLRI